MGDTFGGLTGYLRNLVFTLNEMGELMEVFEQRMTNSELCFFKVLLCIT